MISVTELKEWLETLDPNSDVAIDDGGLNLENHNSSTGPDGEAYIEIGGIPLPEDETKSYS